MKYTILYSFFFLTFICNGQDNFESQVVLHMDKSVDYRNYSNKKTKISITEDTLKFQHLDKNLTYKWIVLEKKIDSNQFRTWVYFNTILSTEELRMEDSTRIVLYKNENGIQFIQFELPPAGDSIMELPIIERYINSN